MKFICALLIAAFVANCCAAVNDKQVKEQHHDLPGAKPTRAPNTTSTVAPTKAVAPLVQVSLTTEPTTVDADTFAIELPAKVDHPLEAEESKPLAVTGFITKNGQIYEIESTNGIGKIESRQTHNDEQYICNYGAVLVYSDVPCDKVANIKIREIEEKPAVDELPPAPVAEELINPADDNENLQNENNLSRPNKSDQQPTKKPVQKHPNKQTRPNKYKKPAKYRPNKPAQSRPNINQLHRPNKNQLHRPNRRPNKNGQNRPNQNVHKRPNKKVQKRPSNNKKKQSQRIQKINQRRWEAEYFNDDDEFFGQIYQRPNQRFFYEYYDY